MANSKRSFNVNSESKRDVTGEKILKVGGCVPLNATSRDIISGRLQKVGEQTVRANFRRSLLPPSKRYEFNGHFKPEYQLNTQRDPTAFRQQNNEPTNYANEAHTQRNMTRVSLSPSQSKAMLGSYQR